MTTHHVMRAALILSFLGSAGCADVDPYRRPGVWRPSGVNAANIASSVVQPADLVRGRGARHADGEQAASAVQRMRDTAPHERAPLASPGAFRPSSGTQ